MSEEATVFGCIFGIGLDSNGIGNASFIHNEQTILRLPDAIDYEKRVFLSSGMFTIPANHPATLFYRTQMIHFGFSVNHLDLYWKDWINQFEDLLHNLYWTETYLYMKGALYIGHTKYYWKADTSFIHEEPLRPVKKWKFRGGPRHFDNIKL